MTYQYHHRHLYRTSNCPTLLRTHMADVAREFGEYEAIAQRAAQYYADDYPRSDFIALVDMHAIPILTLMDEIDSLRKMVVRIIQVQREQINKYRKSIRDWRRTARRGAPPSLESVTMETMIQMSLRVIKGLTDAIPSLIQPVVTGIRGKLCRLHERMFSFRLFTESDRCTFEPDDCRCNCPPCCRGQCHDCHEGICCRDRQTVG